MKTILKKSFYNFIVVLFFLTSLQVFPQTFSTGAVLFDTAAYHSMPLKKSAERGPLPNSYSLKQYAPIPGDQGDYQTCTAWAGAYAARTILESKSLERTDKALTTANAFSPVSVYRNIPDTDIGGQTGTSLTAAVTVLKSPGPARKQNFEDHLPFTQITTSNYQNIQKFPVQDYNVLFFEEMDPVKPVKQALSEGKPVIIGMFLAPSIIEAEAVWNPLPNELPLEEMGHAMCVVGYDDSKYGGAFEILNSWGQAWGNGGYIWIDYKTFAKYTFQAFELVDNPMYYRNAKEHNVVIKLLSNIQDISEIMVRNLDDGLYVSRFAYPEGVVFQFNVKNNNPAYTYILYVNEKNTTAELVFPPNINNPPLLNTRGKFIPTGDVISMGLFESAYDFLILYSRSKLDIENILNKYGDGRGTPLERLAAAVGPNFIPYDKVQYSFSSIDFTADMLNTNSATGLIFTMDYSSDGQLALSNLIKVAGSSSGGRQGSVQDFYMGSGDITRGEFREFVESTGYKTTAELAASEYNWQKLPFEQEENHPVVMVSFYDAVQFCNWRSRQEGLAPVYTISGANVTWNKDADGYRLPTEIEWEYVAARGGLTAKAVRFGVPAQQTVPANQIPANELNIRSSNIKEWVWSEETARPAPAQEPHQVVRGGSWVVEIQNDVQPSDREALPASEARVFIGIRIVRNIPKAH